jgi:hypothetical protein
MKKPLLSLDNPVVSGGAFGLLIAITGKVSGNGG